jgi:hypothetical protein
VEGVPYAELCNWLGAVLDEVPHITHRQVADQMSAAGLATTAQKVARQLKQRPSRGLVEAVITLRDESCGGDAVRARELWEAFGRLERAGREQAAAPARHAAPAVTATAALSRGVPQPGRPGPGPGTGGRAGTPRRVPVAAPPEVSGGQLQAMLSSLEDTQKQLGEVRRLRAADEDAHRHAMSAVQDQLRESGRRVEELERENSALKLASLVTKVEGIAVGEVDLEAAGMEADVIRRTAREELEHAQTVRDEAARDAGRIRAEAKALALKTQEDAAELKLQTLREIRELNVELEHRRAELVTIAADSTQELPPVAPDGTDAGTPLFDSMSAQYYSALTGFAAERNLVRHLETASVPQPGRGRRGLESDDEPTAPERFYGSGPANGGPRDVVDRNVGYSAGFQFPDSRTPGVWTVGAATPYSGYTRYGTSYSGYGLEHSGYDSEKFSDYTDANVGYTDPYTYDSGDFLTTAEGTYDGDPAPSA